jgi:hypothetical protein
MAWLRRQRSCVPATQWFLFGAQDGGRLDRGGGPAGAGDGKVGGEQREGRGCQATVWETWPRTRPRVLRRVWAERLPIRAGSGGSAVAAPLPRPPGCPPRARNPRTRQGTETTQPAPVPVPAGGTGGGCWPHRRHRCVPVESGLRSHLGPGGHGRSRTCAGSRRLTLSVPSSCSVRVISLVRMSTARRTPRSPPAISPYR